MQKRIIVTTNGKSMRAYATAISTGIPRQSAVRKPFNDITEN